MKIAANVAVVALIMTAAWPARAARVVKMSEVLGDSITQAQIDQVLPLPEIRGPKVPAPDVISDSGLTQELPVHGPEIMSIATDEVVAGGKQAADILIEATDRDPNGGWKDLFSNVLQSLYSSSVVVPDPGSNFSGCVGRTMAFTLAGDNKIYVCNFVFQNGYDVPNRLGEILIHESAHLTGYSDECDATKIEVRAMMSSAVASPVPNGYWDQCGIVPDELPQSALRIF